MFKSSFKLTDDKLPGPVTLQFDALYDIDTTSALLVQLPEITPSDADRKIYIVLSGSQTAPVFAEGTPWIVPAGETGGMTFGSGTGTPLNWLTLHADPDRGGWWGELALLFSGA